VEPQINARFLHLDQTPRFPHEIGERGVPLRTRPKATLQGRARFPNALMAKRDEQSIQEDLSLAFFVANQVFVSVRG
jgi:hypothetical protein